MKKTPVFLLSEQLKQFGAINCGGIATAQKLTAFLKKTCKAQVERADVGKGDAPLHFLCPLQSDSTRYVIFDDGEWSYLVSNCWQGPPDTEVSAVSRVMLTNAIVVNLLERDRRMYVYKRGEPVREIQCFDDGGWTYVEDGDPLKFEDPKEQVIRRDKDRLKVSVLATYFERFTGRPVPEWPRLAQGTVYGFEVSYPFADEPPRECRTLMDVK